MSTKKVKIIVTPSANAIKLLKYIDMNIGDIRASGFHIKIQKISRDNLDAEMIEILRKNNIPRLPAMRLPNGKCYIGNNNIISILSKRVQHARSQSLVAAPVTYESFLDRELYDNDENGNRKPRQDNEDGDNDKKDIEQKLSSWQPPKHYKDPSTTDGHRNQQSTQQQYRQPDNVSAPSYSSMAPSGNQDDDMEAALLSRLSIDDPY